MVVSASDRTQMLAKRGTGGWCPTGFKWCGVSDRFEGRSDDPLDNPALTTGSVISQKSADLGGGLEWPPRNLSTVQEGVVDNGTL